MYYQMTKDSAVNKNLTHVINNWHRSSKYLWTKQNHISNSNFLHDELAINMLWSKIKITNNCFNFPGG